MSRYKLLGRLGCGMIGKLLKLINTGIIGLVVLNRLTTSAEEGVLSSTNTRWECPASNNSVCIKNYLHLLHCFKNISGNHENVSIGFFPNNKASSLYVTVTYTIYYDSDNRSGYRSMNFSHDVEEWVWSHTVVYIMYHPTIFKYLSIYYGMIDERVDSVELTIPRLCHDSDENHKIIERLTQMVCCQVAT